MTTMAPLPKDSPIMIAWGKYKATDEYANSRKWAAQEQHVDGSMWAAFLAGYQAHAPSQPAPVVGDDLREAAIRDRAYVLGMKQVLREVGPFVREDDRWWDALAVKLKELDARTEALDKGALRILLDSASPQPDRESGHD